MAAEGPVDVDLGLILSVDAGTRADLLRRRRPAATLGDVPEVDELLAGELTFVGQLLAESAIDAPAPALAATGTAHVRLRHGEIVGGLLGTVQREVEVRLQLLRHAGRDVIGVGWNLGHVRVFPDALD